MLCAVALVGMSSCSQDEDMPLAHPSTHSNPSLAGDGDNNDLDGEGYDIPWNDETTTGIKPPKIDK